MQTVSLFSPPAAMSPALRQSRRHMLARMGLAWLIMMQVMMLAFPGYLRGGTRSLDSQMLLDRAIILMNWSSLVLCVPLILYCAYPIWCGAYRDFKKLRIGMDVPVALSIISAFIPSVITTWRDHGEVYFDSVSMFVAFLLTAKFLELSARQAVSGQKTFTIDKSLLAHADRLAFYFVLVQITLAALVGWYWWQTQPDQALAVTVALLVMSCPCALSMSVPCAIAARQAVILRHPDTDQIPALNTRMQSIARQNLYGSLAWHILMTPLAAIGLVQPWVAAISMLVSSLAVAFNAWRLTRVRLTAASDYLATAG